MTTPTIDHAALAADVAAIKQTLASLTKYVGWLCGVPSDALEVPQQTPAPVTPIVLVNGKAITEAQAWLDGDFDSRDRQIAEEAATLDAYLEASEEGKAVQ